MLPAVAAAKEVRARLVVFIQSGEVLLHLLGPPVVLVVLVAKDFKRVGVRLQLPAACEPELKAFTSCCWEGLVDPSG